MWFLPGVNPLVLLQGALTLQLFATLRAGELTRPVDSHVDLDGMRGASEAALWTLLVGVSWMVLLHVVVKSTTKPGLEGTVRAVKGLSLVVSFDVLS